MTACKQAVGKNVRSERRIKLLHLQPIGRQIQKSSRKSYVARHITSRARSSLMVSSV